MRIDEEERRKAFREGRTPTNQSSSSNQEGYWSYMQRQMTERTERLNFAGDNMERLEESSSNFARDVNKFVQNQKKKAVLGGMYAPVAMVIRTNGDTVLGSKFGL